MAKAQILKQIGSEAEDGRVDETRDLIDELREKLAELRGGPSLTVEKVESAGSESATEGPYKTPPITVS